MVRMALFLAVLMLGSASANEVDVHGLSIDGPIGPATASYVTDGVQAAESAGAEAVLLRIDTPGGLDRAMRDIVQAITNTDVPVIAYVTPSGARAASAGTYILYASHIAAMAPATNLGAATPVSLGGGGTPGGGDGNAGDGGKDERSAKERKRINDAVAYIRGLAELRGRNAEWAERAVREGVSLSASAAVNKDVIDLVAADTQALLAAVDGRSVSLTSGQHRLNTAEASVRERAPDWRQRLLAVISNPNVAYILMLIGIYGLIFELANPGAIVPGVVGGIALLMALFALQALPVNYAGLALLVFGMALMIAEAFAPSFGVLGLGGVVAFAVGSVLLFDGSTGAYRLSWGVVGGASLVTLLVVLGTATMAARSFRQPVVSGQAHLEGVHGTAIDDFDDIGYVRVAGELWRVRADEPVSAGQRVTVVRADGFELRVVPDDQVS